jgi:hypothetical protein
LHGGGAKQIESPRRSLVVVPAIVLALVAATLAGPVHTGSAAIVNSGSTNAPGYRIVVSPDGAATVRQGVTVKRLSLPLQATRAFFHDLTIAQPLRALRAAGCMKSTSFGTTTHIEWHGQSTPDLSCPSSNVAILRLRHDVEVIDSLVWDRRLHTLPVARRRLVGP